MHNLQTLKGFVNVLKENRVFESFLERILCLSWFLASEQVLESLLVHELKEDLTNIGIYITKNSKNVLRNMTPHLSTMVCKSGLLERNLTILDKNTM